MEGIKFLAEAQAAGLQVRRDGDQLIIRGPTRLAVLAQQLLSRKGAILALLEEWEERAVLREYDGGLPRAEAEALAWIDVFGDGATKTDNSST
jgi:hypothetical protein